MKGRAILSLMSENIEMKVMFRRLTLRLVLSLLICRHYDKIFEGSDDLKIST